MNDVSNKAGRDSSRGGRVKRVRWYSATVLLAIPIAFVTSIAWVTLFNGYHQSRLESELAQIRATGQPTTIEELNAWLARPEGENAATAYQQAHAQLEDDRALRDRVPLSNRQLDWPIPEESLTVDTRDAIEAYLTQTDRSHLTISFSSLRTTFLS